MFKNVRVRFAPSPTGPLHIGGVRTALFNYLFAKKHGGTFVLRIEDTDQSRFVEGAEEYIIEALSWCGIHYDEGPASTRLNTNSENQSFGPYRQSERKHLYEQYVQQLLTEGRAYYAFDTPEQLEAHRKDHEAKGKTFIYNWHNREKGRLVNSLMLSEEETQAKLDAGEDYVVRFLSPQDETIVLQDIVRGEIVIDSNILDDKVLYKSDGMPTYHLANVVDDHLMKISHVIRGEEWLPSLALHNLLYRAFNWSPPEFAHLPLILNPTGKGKLSKRHASKLGIPVFPLEWIDPKTEERSLGFREEGYFPEALVNFLAFLGWNPGTEEEIFELDALTKAFSLDKVQKGGARFDTDKAKWFNHHYMQQRTHSDLAQAFKDSRPELKGIDVDYITLVVKLIKERATFVNEFWGLSRYFFVDPKDYDEKAFKKAIKPETAEYLQKLIALITETKEFTVRNIQEKIKGWITDNGIGFGKVMMPLRLALVGSLQGPDVFEIIFLIGKNETVKRIDRLISKLR